MRYPPSCFALLSCSLLTFAWAGCALPVSVHPASDAETSSTDEKLVGIWEKVLTEKERAEYVADGETDRAFELRHDRVGIDRAAAIDRAHGAVHAQFALLERSFDHVRHVARERKVHGDSARVTGR